MTELKPCPCTLTAEQVREAIFNGSSYASYDGAKYYADGISMQAIADELNACAERTCRNLSGDFAVFRCSECGYFERDCACANYCPNCGARVIKSDQDLAQEVDE